MTTVITWSTYWSFSWRSTWVAPLIATRFMGPRFDQWNIREKMRVVALVPWIVTVGVRKNFGDSYEPSFVKPSSVAASRPRCVHRWRMLGSFLSRQLREAPKALGAGRPIVWICSCRKMGWIPNFDVQACGASSTLGLLAAGADFAGSCTTAIDACADLGQKDSARCA